MESKSPVSHGEVKKRAEARVSSESDFVSIDISKLIVDVINKIDESFFSKNRKKLSNNDQQGNDVFFDAEQKRKSTSSSSGQSIGSDNCHQKTRKISTASSSSRCSSLQTDRSSPSALLSPNSIARSYYCGNEEVSQFYNRFKFLFIKDMSSADKISALKWLKEYLLSMQSNLDRYNLHPANMFNIFNAVKLLALLLRGIVNSELSDHLLPALAQACVTYIHNKKLFNQGIIQTDQAILDKELSYLQHKHRNQIHMPDIIDDTDLIFLADIVAAIISNHIINRFIFIAAKVNDKKVSQPLLEIGMLSRFNSLHIILQPFFLKIKQELVDDEKLNLGGVSVLDRAMGKFRAQLLDASLYPGLVPAERKFKVSVIKNGFRRQKISGGDGAFLALGITKKKALTLLTNKLRTIQHEQKRCQQNNHKTSAMDGGQGRDTSNRIDCGLSASKNANSVSRTRRTFDDNKFIKNILVSCVKKALLNNNFLEYLKSRDASSYSTLTLKELRQNLSKYANKLAIIRYYLNYILHDDPDENIAAKEIPVGVLQVLAHIKKKELHVWCLDEQGRLTPYHCENEDDVVYLSHGKCKSKSKIRVDLLLTDNQFELVRFVGYANELRPDALEDIYPFDSLYYMLTIGEKKYKILASGVYLKVNAAGVIYWDRVDEYSVMLDKYRGAICVVKLIINHYFAIIARYVEDVFLTISSEHIEGNYPKLYSKKFPLAVVDCIDKMEGIDKNKPLACTIACLMVEESFFPIENEFELITQLSAQKRRQELYLVIYAATTGLTLFMLRMLGLYSPISPCIEALPALTALPLMFNVFLKERLYKITLNFKLLQKINPLHPEIEKISQLLDRTTEQQKCLLLFNLVATLMGWLGAVCSLAFMRDKVLSKETCIQFDFQNTATIVAIYNSLVIALAGISIYSKRFNTRIRCLVEQSTRIAFRQFGYKFKRVKKNHDEAESLSDHFQVKSSGFYLWGVVVFLLLSMLESFSVVLLPFAVPLVWAVCLLNIGLFSQNTRELKELNLMSSSDETTLTTYQMAMCWSQQKRQEFKNDLETEHKMPKTFKIIASVLPFVVLSLSFLNNIFVVLRSVKNCDSFELNKPPAMYAEFIEVGLAVVSLGLLSKLFSQNTSIRKSVQQKKQYYLFKQAMTSSVNDASEARVKIEL